MNSSWDFDCSGGRELLALLLQRRGRTAGFLAPPRAASIFSWKRCVQQVEGSCKFHPLVRPHPLQCHRSRCNVQRRHVFSSSPIAPEFRAQVMNKAVDVRQLRRRKKMLVSRKIDPHGSSLDSHSGRPSLVRPIRSKRLHRHPIIEMRTRPE